VAVAPSRPWVRVVGRVWHWKWRVLVVAILVGLTAFIGNLNRIRSQPSGPVAAPVAQPTTAQASVVPDQVSHLAFHTSGTVKDVEVKVGDTVKVGQVLATLDTSSLTLKLQDAQANLAIQKAVAAQSTENAPAPDLRAARAALSSALAKQQEVLRAPTAADLKGAQEAVNGGQASLTNAQAQYDHLKKGPTQSDLAVAEANVRAAEAQVASAQQSLDDLKAKPRQNDIASANLAVEQAKNQLWSTQISRDGTCGAAGSDSVPCKSANASVAAQDTGVQLAQAALVQATQPATADQLAAAVKSLQSAKAQLSSAQDTFAKVQAGPTNAEVVAAKSQVDQATATLRTDEAKLVLLQAGATSADVAAAQSAVDRARANLEKLTHGATAATLDLNEARIHEAEIQVALAEQSLKDATLVAPFDGVVTAVNVSPGDSSTGTPMESSGQSTAPDGAITLANLTMLHFETSDLDEVSASKVFAGQPVNVTVPALDKQVFEGTVTAVALQPTTTTSGEVDYVAKIALTEWPPGIRWGETARVAFVTTK